MNNYRHRIGSHVDGDDWRHFEFARRYPHPIATERRLSPDAVVLAVCLVIGVALAVAGVMGWL